MNLSWSEDLKELPDLTNATELKELHLSCCESFVEIPSSFSNLHKLSALNMIFCRNLHVIPDDLNLASLNTINLMGCSKLTTFPQNITSLNLNVLLLSGCRKLESLPEIVTTDLMVISASDCVSLRRVPNCFHSTEVELDFSNCFKLSQEARRSIIQRSFLVAPKSGIWGRIGGWACLPGNQVPEEFNHQTTGNSLTIRLDGNNNNMPLTIFKLCIVISPNHQNSEYLFPQVWYRRTIKGQLHSIEEIQVQNRYALLSGFVSTHLSAQHLFVFLSALELDHNTWSCEILLEFSSISPGFDVTECGAHIWTEETIRGEIDKKHIEF